LNQIPVAIPWLTEEEAQAAKEAVLSRWVTQGPRVAAFEKEFAAMTGAAHAVAVSSCTTALHLALVCAGVKPGDVVITVSHSFIATANAVRHCGAEPVFVDIDEASGNMDPDALAACLADDFEERGEALWYRHTERLERCPESLVSRLRPPVGRLAAVMVVHQVGAPADLGRILPMVRLRNLPLIEDAACAIGSQINLGNGFERIGKPHGDFACFSFHPRKVVTTGDGGMITMADPDMDRLARLLRQHGMSVSDAERHKAGRVVIEEYLTTGFNYRMTDIQAAVGLHQIKRLGDIVAKRRRLAEVYRDALSGTPGVALPLEPDFARTNWQTYVVRLAEPERRLAVMDHMRERGVATRRGVMCSHLEPPYAPAWPAGCLPASERASVSGLVLPLYPEMTEDQVAQVARALASAMNTVSA
jgi:perosamine synthetase